MAYGGFHHDSVLIMDYLIYANGDGNKCYIDRDGNLCYAPDRMGEATARSAYDKALKKLPCEFELCLCIHTQDGHIDPIERRYGEADKEEED